ncbi:MAG: biotin-dependent carboxyltransferase [Chloroflexi bacterium]|nr:biotin-dependent carboxyltransferase [Chloroflexota bacterium]
MLQILEPGILTTIQDCGRNGYQQFGVTRGGAMDVLALRAANALLGNEAGDAAIEIASSGLRARALEKCVVAVAGAPYALCVHERIAPCNAALFLRAGEVLACDAPAWGRYAYLAVHGGFDVPRVLGSRATARRDGFGGFNGRALQAGDVLRATRDACPMERAGKMLSEKFARYYSSDAPLRVIWGPHAEFFDDAAREEFLRGEYHISDLSDRMGTRLKGAAIPRKEDELLSCGVTRGAIQIPPDGQPIVLQADHQTAGGYPILATVIRADIPRLAQKRADELVIFEPTTMDAAREAWRELVELECG